MKKRFFPYFLIITILIGLFGVSIPIEASGKPFRVIVTFDDGVNKTAQNALLNKAGLTLKKLDLVNGAVVLLPDKVKANELLTHVGIKSVEEDIEIYALKSIGGGKIITPPAQTLECGVNKIDAELAHTTTTGSGIKVAILDTGIDKNHADLSIAGGVNFVVKRGSVNPSDWNDDNGHGTHVAGIVSALNNNIGVLGVAPDASLYAVKVLDRRGTGYLSDVISGLEWAINNNMDVVNMSLGTSSDVQALHNAVDIATSAGVILVAASGNSGDGNSLTNNVEYPAKYSSVIAVGATNSSDTVPSWSSDGLEVEVVAPGVAIRSTYKGNSYATLSGTSMATPHVTGVIALMLSAQILPNDVRTLLSATSKDLGTPGFDVFYGNGLVNAARAVGL